VRIYFSGGGGLRDTPEVLLPKSVSAPHVMLTYHSLYKNDKKSMERMEAFLKQLKRKRKKQRKYRKSL